MTLPINIASAIMGFNCKHATFSCVFLVFFVLPPLLIVLLDNTSIFEEPAQLGGEPLPYAAECGYETIEVTSLTVNGQSGVILDADNQYDDHVATMVVNFNSVSNQTVLSSRPNCRELVMFVEEVEERQLPNDAGAYCAGQPGTTVVDNTHAEQFKYSCCSRVDTSCTKKCKYNCPVPPAVQHEFHENFLGIYTKPIHVKSLQSQTPWVESENIEFFFSASLEKSEDPREMFQARAAMAIGFITVATGILAGAVSTMNSAGEENPTALMVSHVVATFVMIWCTVYIMKHVEEENSPFMDGQKLSPRGWLVHCGLSYALITLCYSLFLVYTPHHDEDDAKEQRFPVTKETCTWCGEGNFLKCLECMKSRWPKAICTFLFAVSIPMQIVAMYAIVEVLMEVFFFGPEEASVFAIWYFAVCIIYLVAFVTAIYPDPLPVVVVDGAIVAKKSLRRAKKGKKKKQKAAKPKNTRQVSPALEVGGEVGIHVKDQIDVTTCHRRWNEEEERFEFLTYKPRKEPKYHQDELWVIHTVGPAAENDVNNPDYLNRTFFCEDVNCHHMCWNVGNFSDGKFLFYGDGHNGVDFGHSNFKELLNYCYEKVCRLFRGSGGEVCHETFPCTKNCKYMTEHEVYRVVESSSDESGKKSTPRFLLVGTIIANKKKKNGTFHTPGGMLASFFKLVLRLESDYTDPMFKGHIVASLRDQMFKATMKSGEEYSKAYWVSFTTVTVAILAHIVVELVRCISANTVAQEFVLFYLAFEIVLILVLTLFTLMVTLKIEGDDDKKLGEGSSSSDYIFGGSGNGTRGGGGARTRGVAPGQDSATFKIADLPKHFKEVKECAQLPGWAKGVGGATLNPASQSRHVTLLNDIQYTQNGKLLSTEGDRELAVSKYHTSVETCVCERCALPSVFSKESEREKGKAVLVLNRKSIINMEDYEHSQQAMFVEYQLEGLNMDDRISYGLAYENDCLKQKDDEEKKSPLLALSMEISPTENENGECDVSDQSIEAGKTVIKMRGDNFYAAPSFLIPGGKDPSGWLAFSISATDGSVRVPTMCHTCGGFCHRFEVGPNGGGCDVTGEGLAEG